MRHALVVLFVIFIACNFAFTKDEEIKGTINGPCAVANGYYEEYFYYPALVTDKHCQRAEDDINDWLSNNSNADYLYVTNVPGAANEVMFTVHYKLSDVKVIYRVKIFNLADMSSSSKRKDYINKKRKWFKENPDVEFISFSDGSNGRNVITIITYKPSAAPLAKGADTGYYEEHYYYSNLVTERQAQKIEDEINAMLSKNQGIEYATVTPLFGATHDILFIVRYKHGTNKHLYKVKIFYVSDLTSSTKRERYVNGKKLWLKQNPEVECDNLFERNYGNRVITVITYQTKP